MRANRVQVMPGCELYDRFRSRTQHNLAPERYEVVQYEDVYPTVWAHWGPTEYTVIGYLRDGKLVRDVTRKVNESKGL
jgi:hypothetical protein